MSDELDTFFTKIRTKGIQPERNLVRPRKPLTEAVDNSGNSRQAMIAKQQLEKTRNTKQTLVETPQPVRRGSYKNAPPALLELFDKLIECVEYNGTRIIGQLENVIDQFNESGYNESYSPMRMPMPGIPAGGNKTKALFEELNLTTPTSNSGGSKVTMNIPEIDVNKVGQPQQPIATPMKGPDWRNDLPPELPDFKIPGVPN